MISYYRSMVLSSVHCHIQKLAEIDYAKSRKFSDYSQSQQLSASQTDRPANRLRQTDRQTDRKASLEADCSTLHLAGHRRCCQSKCMVWVPVSDRPIYSNFTFNRLQDIAKYWSVQNCYFSVILLNTTTPGRRLQTQVVTYLLAYEHIVAGCADKQDLSIISK